jgi:hypothetical protein
MTDYPPTALEMSFMPTAKRIVLAAEIGQVIDKKQRFLMGLVSAKQRQQMIDQVLHLQKALKVCRHMNRFATQNQYYA